MNRRDIFKSLLALPVVGCVASQDTIAPDTITTDTDIKELMRRIIAEKDMDRAPIDTDDRYFDNWLDNHNKDEMHL